MALGTIKPLVQSAHVYNGEIRDGEDEETEAMRTQRQERWQRLSTISTVKDLNSVELEQWFYKRCNPNDKSFFRLELDDLLKEKDEIFDHLFPSIADPKVTPEGISNAYKRLKIEQRNGHVRPLPRENFTKESASTHAYIKACIDRRESGDSREPVEESSILAPTDGAGTKVWPAGGISECPELCVADTDCDTDGENSRWSGRTKVIWSVQT